MYEKIQYPQNAEAAWEATKRRMTENVSYFGDIVSRFAKSTKSNPLTLFVPWGVRPAGLFGESEIKAMDIVKDYQTVLDKNAIPSRVLLMPADLYATEVNNYKENATSAYFSTVAREAEKRRFQVVPWSQIRRANRQLYDRILDGEASLESLWKTTPKSLWQDLLASADRRSKQDNKDIAKAAFDYLKERVAEARIIDAVYKPIKVSMVSPNKDAFVDRDLPRLYLLPKELRFPWISNNGGRYER